MNGIKRRDVSRGSPDNPLCVSICNPKEGITMMDSMKMSALVRVSLGHKLTPKYAGTPGVDVDPYKQGV